MTYSIAIIMNARLFSELLAKEMSRKEFLLHAGILFLAITGITHLLKTISDPNVGRGNAKMKGGFGAGPYGV